MKNFTLLLGIGFMLFSCKSDKVGPKPTEKVLKYQKSITLPNGKLSFIGVSEGRCPWEANVSCISGGSVIVDLELRATQASTSSKQVKMCLGDCAYDKSSKYNDTLRVGLGNITYSLTLLEVNPYPTKPEHLHEKDREKYSIKLKIQTVL